jgi:hypothetical protein
MGMPGLTEWLILVAIVAAVVYGIRRVRRRPEPRGFDVLPPKEPDFEREAYRASTNA